MNQKRTEYSFDPVLATAKRYFGGGGAFWSLACFGFNKLVCSHAEFLL